MTTPVSDNNSQHVSRTIERLACPQCHTRVVQQNGSVVCVSCLKSYAVNDNLVDLRPAVRDEVKDMDDWSDHWSDDNQESLAQKFFSVYRKEIFARTVRYFVGRYFPPTGVFVEAGSGTSESSLRIDKLGGSRTLVAMDIVLPVLEKCDPIMDVRLGGDIFNLPLLDNSVDGIWNVGVMEHFTHDQIDAIMREFHRVLKPGATLIMLWPATNSLPQKGLRLAEKVINMRKPPEEKFRFHPDEISQLHSMKEGRHVLTRNGFDTVFIDFGLRSGMAFQTVVGRKP